MRFTDSAVAARSLADVVEDQYRVATRNQLEEMGSRPDDIDRQLRGGRWRRLNEAVIVLHNGPLTLDQQHAAVALSAPAPVALCSVTAAFRAGLRGYEDERVHVVVPRGARVLHVAGVRVRVHESRRFDAHDVKGVGFPPRVGVERAVVDAASWAKSPNEGVRLLTAAVQQGLTRPSLLMSELEAAGQIRRRRLIEQILHDIGGGAQALSEIAFVRFCRRHRLPLVSMQVRLNSEGHRRYLDAQLQAKSGQLVGVEIDGGVHLSLAARWRDTSRDNDLLIDGAQILRFPSVAIYTDDPLAVRQLRRAVGHLPATVSATTAISQLSR